MTGMGSRLLKTWLLEPHATAMEVAAPARRHHRPAPTRAAGQASWNALPVRAWAGVSDVERITAHRPAPGAPA